MSKRQSYKTISLEGLERDSNLSGEWTWQQPSTYKWDVYKLKESDTEKSHTISYLQVHYNRKDANAPWKEDHRYRFYRRQAKYLAVNGPLEGSYIVSTTPDYKLYYTQYGTNGSNLPHRIMVHVDSLARKLGLLW